jgi:tetratricopeptide (TPR) repeat protein
MKAGLLAALFGLALPAAPALAQERCGLARDLVARALERITAPERQDEVEDALQLVKHAIERCPASGDAWYYRSLFERKLKRVPQAEFALRQARAAGSEALASGVDPFRLSSPLGEPPSKVVREKWALVVGIGKFRDRGVPLLRYTAKDARDFAATLVDERFGRFRPDHVKTLFDADATTSRKAELAGALGRAGRPGGGLRLQPRLAARHGHGRRQLHRHPRYGG